jgi:hypothetical protein
MKPSRSVSPPVHGAVEALGGLAIMLSAIILPVGGAGLVALVFTGAIVTGVGLGPISPRRATADSGTSDGGPGDGQLGHGHVGLDGVLVLASAIAALALAVAGQAIAALALTALVAILACLSLTTRHPAAP